MPKQSTKNPSESGEPGPPPPPIVASSVCGNDENGFRLPPPLVPWLNRRWRMDFVTLLFAEVPQFAIHCRGRNYP